MWKLFQSVLKTFRTQSFSSGYNRVTSATQDTVSSKKNPSKEDEGEEKVAVVKPQEEKPNIPQAEPDPVSKPPYNVFPRMKLPTTHARRSDSRKYSEVVASSRVLKVKVGRHHDNSMQYYADKRKRQEAEFQRRVKPSMGSLHNAMGLAAMRDHNKDLALEHFRVAADVYGSPKANYNLGVIYDFHLSNKTEAARRYRKAGDHADALFNLACLMLNGPDAQVLMPRAAREKEALKLLNRSAELGSKEASKFLNYFHRKNLEEIKKMAEFEAELFQSSSPTSGHDLIKKR